MTLMQQHMETGIEGLYASAPEQLPFAPSLEIRAFLLQRDRGNLLVYSTTGLESEAAAIEDLGGISRHYLNHRHEAIFPSENIGAPLFVHGNEHESVAETYHVRGTFSRRHTLDDDFEVIPTPGHTPGATAYLWDSGRHRFLFTGDTIYLDGGEWVAAVLASSDRDAYARSLELIRELDFDVLVPWAAAHGGDYYAVTSRADARRRIDRILRKELMTGSRTPSQQITDEVTAWPGVEAGPGRRGEFAFTVGRREIGHLHGDHAAHFGFPKDVWAELKEQGRIVDHPVFPGKPGPGARRIDGEADVRDVIELLRLNYDRVVARHGLPDDE